MAIGSNILTSYPIKNKNQPSQPFRDNFATIKTEIENLQSKIITFSGDMSGASNQFDAGHEPIPVNLIIKPNIVLTGNEGVTIPRGDNSQRPLNPLPGNLRFNIQTSIFEGWDGTNWLSLTENAPVSFVDDLSDLNAISPTVAGQIVYVGNTTITQDLIASESAWGLFVRNENNNTWQQIIEEHKGLDETLSFTKDFTFEDLTQFGLGVIPAGYYVTKIIVQVTTPFNGTNPTLSIGRTGAINELMAVDENYLKDASIFEVQPFHLYSAITALRGYFTVDGSTAGAGRITISYARY